MPQILPFEPSEAFYRFTTTLEDTDYIFDVRWNDRDAAWYFDVLRLDETVVRAGNKIVLGAFPGRRSSDADFPPGVFMVVDTSGSDVDATYDDIGVRVFVHYYTQAEFTSLL